MIRLALFLIFAAGPALATQDGWPALYDVTGVDSTDVLNIRSEPGAAGDVIGALPPDAQNVEVIRDNDGRATWGLINTGEGTGWVSLNFMARQPGQWAGSMPEIRQCFGTEPFWSLTHEGASITLKTPAPMTRDGLISGRFRSKTSTDRFVYSGSFFPDDDGIVDIVLTLRTEACSDGMSDQAFGIGLDMFLSGSTNPEITGLYSGCCSIAPPAE